MDSRKKNRKPWMIAAVIIVIVVVIAVIAGAVLMKKYTPSKEQTDYTEYYNLTKENEMIVVVDNTRSATNGFYIDGHAYVDYDTVHDSINSRFFWDSTEQVLRYALPDNLISVGADTNEYTLGKEKKQESY